MNLSWVLQHQIANSENKYLTLQIVARYKYLSTRSRARICLHLKLNKVRNDSTKMSVLPVLQINWLASGRSMLSYYNCDSIKRGIGSS